jgi:hypothetical protein
MACGCRAGERVRSHRRGLARHNWGLAENNLLPKQKGQSLLPAELAGEIVGECPRSSGRSQAHGYSTAV